MNRRRFSLVLATLLTGCVSDGEGSEQNPQNKGGNSSDTNQTDSSSSEDTSTYVGNLSGNGPLGLGVEGKMTAEVDFESGSVTGEVTGESISGGTFQGEINTSSGSTEGNGSVDAFGMSGITFEFNGNYTSDNSSATGTWESKEGVDASGTWSLEKKE